MATSPAIASLSRCADQIQKYLTLQDAVAPGAAMVACADRLASDLQVPRALRERLILALVCPGTAMRLLTC